MAKLEELHLFQFLMFLIFWREHMRALWHGKLYVLLALSGAALLIACYFIPFFPSFFQTYFPGFFKTEKESILYKNQCMQWYFYGIDSDSSDYCYVAFDTSVFVFDSQGFFLFRYQKPLLGSSYDFSVENDTLCFWFSRGNDMYNYSFDGFLLNKRPYLVEEKPNYSSFFEQRKCVKNGELKYQYHSLFGFWWITDNQNKTIIHVPFSVYVIKLITGLFIICLILLINKGYKSFYKGFVSRTRSNQ